MQIYVQQLSAYIADKSSVQPREQRGHCDGGAAPSAATGRSAATGGLCGEGGSSISVPDFSRKHTQTHTHTRTPVHTHPRTQAGTAHTHLCTRHVPDNGARTMAKSSLPVSRVRVLILVGEDTIPIKEPLREAAFVCVAVCVGKRAFAVSLVFLPPPFIN